MRAPHHHAHAASPAGLNPGQTTLPRLRPAPQAPAGAGEGPPGPERPRAPPPPLFAAPYLVLPQFPPSGPTSPRAACQGYREAKPVQRRAGPEPRPSAAGQAQAADKGARKRVPAPAAGPQLVSAMLLHLGGPISCSGRAGPPLSSLRACSLLATVYPLLLRAEAALPWHAGALGYMSFGGAKGMPAGQGQAVKR
jgi:hypothetical protein